MSLRRSVMRAAARKRMVARNYAASVLADSPVAYWRLGEASGTTMNDASPNALHGTYTGVTLGQTGLVAGDTAAAFAGTSSSYARRASHNSFNSTHISADLWVRTNVAGRNEALVSRDTQAGLFANRAFQLRLLAGKPEAFILNSEGQVATVTAPSAVTVGAKTHVGFSYDRQNLRLYVNGAQVAVTPSTIVTNTTAVVDVLLGAFFDGTAGLGILSSWQLSGVLDEVAIYPTALSADRFLAHYNEGL